VSTTAPTITPETQAKYQVRFDFGPAGLARIGNADVIVWVDALASAPAASIDTASIPDQSAVIAAGLVNRSAAAQWIVDHQIALGRRVSISIVAAGRDGGFASQDFLAAGAVIDALVARGIDFTSPEAAVASAAFEGLRSAVGHLFTASVSGQEKAAAGDRDAVKASAAVDSSTDVEVLRAQV
jgi:phosphosulfolactate phosphohydrolase-like enzyme